ncbi:MAG TPA: Glu/Leu/Phe/Val dehydrogenase dimerization domain-containing protein [Bryobacterales bacterium]|nr:Glu/Leu/Phe/Val dehydrogenase dimerization domain-containing protein [Bryobacterales bacterium]
MKESIYPQQSVESVREIRDEALGLHGYLVIGSRINGLTCGGLRIHDDVSIQELKDLAKVMELKQTFLGMPRGGARAGIRAPADLPEHRKQALINRFAELAKDELVGRKWLVAIDVGTNIHLMHNMYRHIGVAIPKPSQQIANAGFFTALGVAKSVETSLEIKNREFADASFAIEGMGNVGASLFRALKAAGARITAASNVKGALVNETGLSLEEGLSLAAGAPVGGKRTKVMAKERLLELPVNVLCPCATDSTISSANASRIRAEIVCAGANNPVTHEAARILFAREILYLPDFVTNSGGALGNMVKFAGLPERYLHGILANELIRELRGLHAESQRQGRPPSEIAVAMLNEKFAKMKAALESKRRRSVLRELGLSLYRKGMVPRYPMRPFAIRTIRRSIGMQ